MADAYAALRQLQSLRLLRARREMEQRQREVSVAREASLDEARRGEAFEALAGRVQAEIRLCCQARPVRMAEVQRLLDYVATARHEAKCSATRLRRLRIVQERAEETLHHALRAYQHCELRQKAVDRRAARLAQATTRQREGRAEEQVLETHASALSREPT